MSLLIDSIKKGPVMTMTLECETEFPRALKDNMKDLGFEGAAVYKSFPFMTKARNISGWNSTCTRAKMMTTRPKGVV